MGSNDIELSSFAGDDAFCSSIVECARVASAACMLVTGASLSGRTTLLHCVSKELAEGGAIVKRWSSDQSLATLQPSHTSVAAYFARAQLTLIVIDDVDCAIAASRGLQQFLSDCVRTATTLNARSSLKTVFLLSAAAGASGKSFKAFALNVIQRTFAVPAPSEDQLCEWLMRDLCISRRCQQMVHEHVRRHGCDAAAIAKSTDALQDLRAASRRFAVDDCCSAQESSSNGNSQTTTRGTLSKCPLPAPASQRPSPLQLCAAQMSALLLWTHASIAESSGLGGSDASRSMAHDICCTSDTGYGVSAGSNED